MRFLVADFDAGTPGNPNPEYGVPFALEPGRATGIPIPAFRSGPVTPLVGQTAGEAFLNTTSDQGFVWDGARWNPIAPSAITRYPSDADVLNDTLAAVGTYGTAEDTGNLYIMATTGWRMVGVRTYVDMAALTADPAADGSIGVAMAEQSIWLRTGGVWVPQSPIVYLTEALLLAATPPDGSIGMARDTGLIYGRMNGVWRRSNSPTMTVAAVRPATPPDGSIGMARDTGLIYGRMNGVWRRSNSPTMTVAAARPRANFTTDQQGNHNHGWTGVTGNAYPDGAGDSTSPGHAQSYPRQTQQLNAGQHSHSITGGGDSETAPNHIRLLPIIRAA
jgi:hypothetical protein